MTARIAQEPTHREVKVAIKPIDLSIKGILDRVQSLAADAHQRGDITPADLDEIKTSAAKLRAVFTRVDESHLIRRVPRPMPRPR
ncbi:MAG TPA: hypothetical protein VHT91_10765 [Kofleriaceae bacterium]|jgi:hypothetical protein|nr:hypothetical protein [Kofleriaceae bacterium]